MEKKNHAVAYVDGSYSNNTAGYGVVFFYDPSSYNNVLKWMLRGLSLDDAIHKVNVDYEIASNCTYY